MSLIKYSVLLSFTFIPIFNGFYQCVAQNHNLNSFTIGLSNDSTEITNQENRNLSIVQNTSRMKRNTEAVKFGVEMINELFDNKVKIRGPIDNYIKKVLFHPIFEEKERKKHNAVKRKYINSKSATKGLDIFPNFKTDLKDNFKSMLSGIYPGTLWCGDGDRARSSEVGIFYLTDHCCQKHDRCPEFIVSKEEKYTLKNVGLFSRTHCDCDKEFYDCLKQANTVVSRKIGYTYFDVLGPECFRQEHPIVDCMHWIGERCETYVIDETRVKEYQWFDNKFFSQKRIKF